MEVNPDQKSGVNPERRRVVNTNKLPATHAVDPTRNAMYFVESCRYDRKKDHVVWVVHGLHKSSPRPAPWRGHPSLPTKRTEFWPDRILTLFHLKIIIVFYKLRQHSSIYKSLSEKELVPSNKEACLQAEFTNTQFWDPIPGQYHLITTFEGLA